MTYPPLNFFLMLVFFLVTPGSAEFRAPCAYIAGTFDAIFLSGIMAVLLSY